MIRFYFNGSPNPAKIALFLEEAGLPYEGIPIDTRRGDQFNAAYLAVNPNAKVPAIVDGETVVFDSNAILLYLGEKTGKFIADAKSPKRPEMLSWLMFIATGVGPYCGQAVHFKHFSPEKVPYAHKRYQFEAMRHLTVANARLADRRYMLGNDYTIVDMSLWSWARMVPFMLGDEAWPKLPVLKRWFDEIDARPAAKRASTLKDRHPFKVEMDEDARKHMFKHLAQT